jgi:hypothetical protein
VYFAFASIIGNTFVSDAAASTVGTEPPVLAAGLAGAEFVVDTDVVAREAAELELLLLLLPQPTAAVNTPIAMITPNPRRAEVAPNKRTASLIARQNPGTLTKLWH